MALPRRLLLLLFGLQVLGSSLAASNDTWTVLLYQAGDNSLNCPLLTNLLQAVEAAKIGAGTGVNLFVLIDQVPLDGSERPCDTSPNFTFQGAREYWDASAGTPTYTTVDNGLPVNTADPATLEAFILAGLTRYPAKRYLLILSDHGGGWQGFGTDDNPSSSSTNSTGPMSNKDIAAAIRNATMAANVTRVDVLAFDACLMSAYSALSVFYPVADYIVASEEVEPGNGYDYRVLNALVTNSTMSDEYLGDIIIRGFAAINNDTNAITNAVIDSTVWGAQFLPSFRTLCSVIARNMSTTPDLLVGFSIARSQVLEMISDYLNAIDLGGFLELLNGTSAVDSVLSNTTYALVGPQIQAALVAYKASVRRTVFGETYDKAGATGVSIYFPVHLADLNPAYLDVADPAGWNAVLQAYYTAVAEETRSSNPSVTFTKHTAPIAIIPIAGLPDDPDFGITGNLSNPNKAAGVDLFVAQKLGTQTVVYSTMDAALYPNGTAFGEWDGYIWELANTSTLNSSKPLFEPITMAIRFRSSGSDIFATLSGRVLYDAKSDSFTSPQLGTLVARYFYGSGKYLGPDLFTDDSGASAEVPRGAGGYISPIVKFLDGESGNVTLEPSDKAFIWGRPDLDFLAVGLADSSLDALLPSTSCESVVDSLVMALVATDWVGRKDVLLGNTSSLLAYCSSVKATATPRPTSLGTTAASSTSSSPSPSTLTALMPAVVAAFLAACRLLAF